MLVDIQPTADKGRVFTLKEPEGLLIQWKGKAFTVPYGFQSDGASVPRLFWRLVFPSSDTKALRAAFAHDYIYRTHPDGWTKAEADSMFYDLLREDGVQFWRAGLAYIGVRIGGFLPWVTRGEI